MSIKMEVLGNYLDSFKLIDEARMGVFWAADLPGWRSIEMEALGSYLDASLQL